VKVALLGVGGLGRILALELASDSRVTELVLVDKRGDRSKALKSIGRTTEITPMQADVSRRGSLLPVLSGVEVAVNATLPENNLEIMAACLDAGCGYVDGAGLSPVRPGENPGVLDQLRLDDAYRARGLTAIVSMGSDPGISNIMARAAADRLETVDEVRVLKAACGGDATEGFPLYSREIFLRDALSPPTIWESGKLSPQPFVSGEEDYLFPEPIGRRHLYNFYHEEVITLPLRLGRPVARVCYKHDLKADLVRAIVALEALGLFAPDRRVKIGMSKALFRDTFLATFPEPSTLIGPIAGAMGIVVEVKGTRHDRTKGTVRGTIVMDHREANRRRGTTAERLLTAAVASAGIMLIHEKKVPRPGVLAPEELPPDGLMPELEARDIRFHIEETAA
jgi:saccharopine dehydrogenase (NAD+, L-lysine-forming)